MAIYSLNETMKRISQTKSDSPVVVMVSDKPYKFDVFFYGTVYGHTMAKEKPEGFVGVFHRGMPQTQVYTKLSNMLTK